MTEPSQEQQIILDHVRDGKNVVVDACAGSGKSTTILSCAKYLPDVKMIQFTYNAQLRKEIGAKIIEQELKNISVHTYHSFFVQYYYDQAYSDTGLRRILREKIKSRIDVPSFSIVIIDEAQDMTSLYFEMLNYFLRDMGSPFQILVLGDKYQGLYDFKGADTRFLTLAHFCWRTHPLLKSQEFVLCSLQTSYRITKPMAQFINDTMLDETRIFASKHGTNVKYIRNDRVNLERVIIGRIKTLVQNGFSHGEVFVLCGSVKGTGSQIRRLENLMVENNIPCYIPMKENQDQLDKRVIDKKVVFSTLHSVKGRERKIVFVIGFDNTYFTYFAKNIPQDICPNTLYVACTRAKEELFILESRENKHIRPLPFLKMSHVDMMLCDFIDFQGSPAIYREVIEEDKTKRVKYKQVTPTELIRFISDPVLDIITPIVDKIFSRVQDSFQEIDIPSIIETKSGFYEEVSDLNGIVLPILFYDHIRGTKDPILQDIIRYDMREAKPNDYSLLKDHVRTMPAECETISDYLYLANLSLAVQEKLYSKITQIQRDEYTWLSDETVQQCNHRFQSVLGDDCKGYWEAEKTIIQSSMDEDHCNIDACLSCLNSSTFRFTARVDLITTNTIWEIKCTTQITIDHMLQLVIYAWLWRTLHPEVAKDFRLFNIKTGELWKLDASLDELTKIVVELLRDKYEKVFVAKTDEQFIQETKSIISTINDLA